MFGSFAVISKLKSLLTEQNLRLLDMVLAGITDEEMSSAAPFWEWMRKQTSKTEVNHAYFALVKLREILNEYRGK